MPWKKKNEVFSRSKYWVLSNWYHKIPHISEAIEGLLRWFWSPACSDSHRRLSISSVYTNKNMDEHGGLVYRYVLQCGCLVYTMSFRCSKSGAQRAPRVGCPCLLVNGCATPCGHPARRQTRKRRSFRHCLGIGGGCANQTEPGTAFGQNKDSKRFRGRTSDSNMPDKK